MTWLRRVVSIVLGRKPESELDVARAEVQEVANRADAKMRDASRTADRIFRGVERRRVPRT